VKNTEGIIVLTKLGEMSDKVDPDCLTPATQMVEKALKIQN